MKSLKLTAITAAVISASAATGAYASLDNFLQDSSFDVKLRNVYFDRDTKGFNKKSDPNNGSNVAWHEYAQAIELNYKSGYLFDMFGFDLSNYNTLKLDSSSSASNSNHGNGSLLPSKHINAHGNPRYDDGTSLGKLGQAFLKFKLGNEDMGLHAKYGMMTMDTVFIASSTSRAIPSSFYGSEIDANLFGVNLYGVYADRVSERTSTSYDDFVNHLDGDKLDNMYAVGAKTNIVGMNLSGEYAETKDFIKQYYVGADYTIDYSDSVALLLDGQYYSAKRGGNLWDGKDVDSKIASFTPNFTDKAHLQNINALLSVGHLDLGLSYSKVSAKGGFYDYVMAYNDYGGTNFWTSRQISDFNVDGERALQASAMYEFGDLGLPGFFAGVTYTQGDQISAAQASKVGYDKETEINTEVGYRFNEGALKGLSLSAQHGYWTADKPDFATADMRDAREADLRVYVDYTVSVF